MWAGMMVQTPHLAVLQLGWVLGAGTGGGGFVLFTLLFFLLGVNEVRRAGLARASDDDVMTM